MEPAGPFPECCSGTRLREFRSTLAICLVLAGAQSVGINRPFLRHHESEGTQCGKHARNYLKFGLSFSRGAILDVSGPTLSAYDEPRDYLYPNHPPSSVLLMAGAFAVFGIREAVLRAVLIVFSVGAVFLFERLARRRLPWPWSGISTAIFALNPMFLYFSVVTVQQVITLVFILAALVAYDRWLDGGGRLAYAALVAAIVLACLTDWPGYYVAPAIVLSHFLGRRDRRGPAAALLGVNVLVFGLYVLYLAWTGGDAPHKLFEAGLSRSSLRMPPMSAYVAGEARELALYFTVPLVVLAIAGLWIKRDVYLASLLFLGADEIAFAQVAGEHDYYSYYLVVFMALAGAEGLRCLAARSRPLAWLAAILFLAQSAWISADRLTREGAYEFYYRLALAVNRATRPEDRLLILTDDIRFYTPFYGDRYVIWYDPTEGDLVTENTAGRRHLPRKEDVRSFVRENPGHCTYAVTADPREIRREVRALLDADDTTLRRFGVHDDDREFLTSLCGPPRDVGGFLFWPLTRR